MSTFAYCPDCRNELFTTGLPGNSDQSKKTSLYKRSVMEKLLDIAAPIIQKTYFGKDLEVLKKLEGIFEEAFEQLDEGQEIPLRRETFKDALKFRLTIQYLNWKLRKLVTSQWSGIGISGTSFL